MLSRANIDKRQWSVGFVVFCLECRFEHLIIWNYQLAKKHGSVSKFRNASVWKVWQRYAGYVSQIVRYALQIRFLNANRADSRFSVIAQSVCPESLNRFEGFRFFRSPSAWLWKKKLGSIAKIDRVKIKLSFFERWTSNNVRKIFLSNFFD